MARSWQERYSASKKNEIPTQLTAQVNREDTAFGEMSQSQKGQSCGPHPREVRGEPNPQRQEADAAAGVRRGVSIQWAQSAGLGR